MITTMDDSQRTLEEMDENVMILTGNREDKLSQKNQVKKFYTRDDRDKDVCRAFAVTAGVINIFILMISEIERKRKRYALMLVVGRGRSIYLLI